MQRIFSDNIPNHNGQPVLLAGEDGAGVEEGDGREQGPVGDLRQEEAERLLAGTAALVAVRVLHSHWSRSNQARLSLVESFRVLLPPAI